ncbi:MAG: porin family protein [Ferruginibacter sp.]
MSNKSAIDELFKSELSELPVTGKEDMWQRMEQKLDGQKKGSILKKRSALLLLLLIGSGTGIFFMTRKGNEITGKNDVALNSSSITEKTITNSATASDRANTTTSYSSVTTKSFNNTEDKTSNAIFVSNTKPGLTEKGKQKIGIQSAEPEIVEVVNENESAISGTEKINIVTAMQDAEANSKKNNATLIQSKTAPENIAPENKVSTPLPVTSTAVNQTKKKEKSNSKFSAGIVAGMDLFLKAKETGFYGGLQLTVPVNKKVNIVTGLQVSRHKMEENYSNAEKQRINPDKNIDAKLQGLTVIQVPILYEQPLPGNKVKFRAGLTPTYIVNAGIYNVPNSFTGNVVNYRKFTLEDLHRLNVLFTASIGVDITKNIELELKGNYGLTELVKNSYILQSSVNNNFKAAQVGIIFKPGKKK